MLESTKALHSGIQDGEAGSGGQLPQLSKLIKVPDIEMAPVLIDGTRCGWGAPICSVNHSSLSLIITYAGNTVEHVELAKQSAIA
jgi:hypothetical protein